MIFVAFIFLAVSSIFLGLSKNKRGGWKALFFYLGIMSLAVALRWGMLYLQFCATIFGKVLFIISALIALIVICVSLIKGKNRISIIIQVIAESVNLPFLIGDYWIASCKILSSVIKWIKSC